MQQNPFDIDRVSYSNTNTEETTNSEGDSHITLDSDYNLDTVITSNTLPLSSIFWKDITQICADIDFLNIVDETTDSKTVVEILERSISMLDNLHTILVDKEIDLSISDTSTYWHTFLTTSQKLLDTTPMLRLSVSDDTLPLLELTIKDLPQNIRSWSNDIPNF